MRAILVILAAFGAAALGAAMATVAMLGWAGAHFRQVPLD